MPDADAACERLQGMFDKMRAAANWPWKASTVFHYRETVWPSLFGKLADQSEAIRLRAEMDAEIARLDAAA
jgi:hypothetical protein